MIPKIVFFVTLLGAFAGFGQQAERPLQKFLRELNEAPQYAFEGIQAEVSVADAIRAIEQELSSFDLYEFPDPKEPHQLFSIAKTGGALEVADRIRALATNELTHFSAPIARCVLSSNAFQHISAKLSNSKPLVDRQGLLVGSPKTEIRAKLVRKDAELHVHLSGAYARLKKSKKTPPVYTLCHSEDEQTLKKGEWLLLIWASIEPRIHGTVENGGTSAPLLAQDFTRPDTRLRQQMPQGPNIGFLLLTPTLETK